VTELLLVFCPMTLAQLGLSLISSNSRTKNRKRKKYVTWQLHPYAHPIPLKVACLNFGM